MQVPGVLARASDSSTGEGMEAYRTPHNSSASSAPEYAAKALRSMNLRERLESRQAYFKSLVQEWQDDTDFMSSPTKRKNHRAYRKILSMGKIAVPYILRELRDNGGDWYEALSDILLGEGVSPVRPEDQGDIDKMKEAWILWGREHGYDV
jgi:hypothetical protein